MRSALPVATLVSAALALGLTYAPSHAETTRLMVRVLAHDAKLIGDAAGGAQVLVRERDTGALLARGAHLGGTGSTEKIIVEPHRRGDSIYDTEGAAGFRCELDLRKPTWITVEANAPLASPQSLAQASRTILMLPGRHIDGDGIVLELSGLIVNLLEPNAEATLHGGEEIEVRAGVKLLCTCPIYEGSLWNAKDYRVQAELWSQGERLHQVDLRISETHNVFVGRIHLPDVAEDASLVAELRMVAGNDDTHNFGVDRTVFKIVH